MSRSKPAAPFIRPEWRSILQRPKTIVGWPDWPFPSPVRSGAGIATPRDSVHTRAYEGIEILFALADDKGEVLEGVRLRLSAWAFRRNCDTTATLEVLRVRTFVTISRVDAWPATPHRNTYKVLKKPGLKAFAAEIPGCHVHRFDDNVKYGPEAFGGGPEGNLPVAAAFPESLKSFRDFLRFVAVEFNIKGLGEFPSPPSWRGLI